MFFKFGLLLSVVLMVSGELVGIEPKPRLDGKIVGGFVIDIAQAPWQISFQLHGSHFCGGSIIADRWILTAAHCTSHINANNLADHQVRVGSSVTARNGTVYKLKRFIRNVKYNPKTVDYDYALLELSESIEFSDKVKAIALPNPEDTVPDNTTCFVSGWGNTQNSNESRFYLRAAEVPTVNQQKCHIAYKRYGGVTPRMLCAGFNQGGKDACQGDSGGPLALLDAAQENPILVGVVSWGLGCAQRGYPGVYSRVQVARKWISENTGI